MESPLSVTPAGRPVAVNLYGGTPPAATTEPEMDLPSEISPRLPGPEMCRSGEKVALPAARTRSREPAASTATGFVMPIDTVVVLAASVSWMSARIPVDIVFALEPATRQVKKPGVELQESVFPAAVAAGPAVAPMVEI